MSMTAKRKHSKAEIAAKLIQADELATQGMPQREIARTLGVSAMTLHRWRKIRADPRATLATPQEVARFEDELGSVQQIAELEV
jgi:transposase-like protein